MMKINNLVLSLILLSIASVIQAKIVMYEEWINPKTGQILEEFFDLHRDSPDAEEQLINFIDRMLPYKDNIVLITEDNLSLMMGLHALPNPALEELLPMVKSASFLNLSYARARVKGIQVVNIEARKKRPGDLAPTVGRDNTTTFHDGHILDDFYAKVQEARKLSEGDPENDLKKAIYGLLVVDANALHVIAENSNKHIELCAGIFHCLSINNVLRNLGWQLTKVIVPNDLTEEQSKTIRSVVDRTSIEDPLRLMSDALSGDIIDDATKKLLESGISLSTIPINPKLNALPLPIVPSGTAEAGGAEAAKAESKRRGDIPPAELKVAGAAEISCTK